MSTEQAYINGFVKKASEYGVSTTDAIELLKSANAMPDSLKKKLMSILKGHKVTTDMKGRLLAGGIGGAYLGLASGGRKGNEEAASGSSAMDALKRIIVGGGLGLAAMGTSGLLHNRRVLNNYMKQKVAPRFEEMLAKDPRAPLNRLSNLIQAETKHNVGDLQNFVSKNNVFVRPDWRGGTDFPGDEWKNM